jgi:hypothetical protein
MAKKTTRAMTEAKEAELPPSAVVSQGRVRARNAFAAIKPQVRKLAKQSTKLATDVYGKKALQIVRQLEDDDVSSADWLMDVTALAIGHWLDPLGKLADIFSKDKTSKPQPSQFIKFDLDQGSQAVDPLPLDVPPAIHEAVRDGRVTSAALMVGNQVVIPAANVRFSVADGQTYVSLVDLASTALEVGQFTGEIRLIIDQPVGGQTVAPMTVPVTVGTARTNIATGPATNPGLFT